MTTAIPASPAAPASPEHARRAQLHAAADAYFEALIRHDFSLIPYGEDVVLRVPIAPGGVHAPLVGRDTVREEWWNPVAPALAGARVLDRYVNDDLTGICVAAEVEIVGLTRPLRVAERFRVDAAGRIVEQENHFDPRDVTNPGWQDAERLPAS